MDQEFEAYKGKLTTLASLVEGKTFSSTNNSVVSRTYYGGLWRRVYGENRSETLSYIEKIMTDAFLYILSSKALSLVELYDSAKSGIKTLAATYKDDSKFSTQVNELVTKISNNIALLDYLLEVSNEVPVEGGFTKSNIELMIKGRDDVPELLIAFLEFGLEDESSKLYPTNSTETTVQSIATPSLDTNVVEATNGINNKVSSEGAVPKPSAEGGVDSGNRSSLIIIDSPISITPIPTVNNVNTISIQDGPLNHDIPPFISQDIPISQTGITRRATPRRTKKKATAVNDSSFGVDIPTAVETLNQRKSVLCPNFDYDILKEHTCQTDFLTYLSTKMNK